MDIGQTLTATMQVATLIGGNFSSAFPVIVYVAEVITAVETMKGLTGPQKLAKAQQLINDGVTTVPALAKLVKDPAKLTAVVNELVALANLFIK